SDAIEGSGEIVVRTDCVQVDGPMADRLRLLAGSYVLIEVRDTGTGIPADVLPHIFDPFFTTKQPGSGTGLGLAVVKEVVEAWSGAVSVACEVNKGTTFSVYLPFSDISQSS